jgi:hypothetical protein
MRFLDVHGITVIEQDSEAAKTGDGLAQKF